ncbi:MAG: serine hydrolase, partial [Planctomycetota bacterium]
MPDRFEWQMASPESQRFSTERLDELRDRLGRQGTKSFLLIRGDRIVQEWYAPDHGPDKLHWNASLDKAIVAGVALAVAMTDGRIDPDDRAARYVRQWDVDALKSRITIRQLATHSSGLENAALAWSDERLRRIMARGDTRVGHQESLPGWKGAFWRRERSPFLIARDETPVIFPPGSDYHYSNPGIAMLGYVLAACLRDAPQTDVLSLLRERVMRPIGVADDHWRIGYGTEYEADGLKLHAGWGGGNCTARAIARLGRLMLRKGDWEGRQIINPAVVEAAVAWAGTPIPDRSADLQPASGLSWWTNVDGNMSALPRDAFMGMGAGNELLVVIPSLQIILVRQGLQFTERLWAGAHEHLFRPVMEAIMPPCAFSPVITGIEWAPPETIIRKGFDHGPTGWRLRDAADNWPVTWADDDCLYTAWGDGRGFIPPTRRLSMGLARVSGSPPEIRGENIPSDAEATGDGPSGPKASGMLMVDGVLYMLVRNADRNGHESHLGWSTDHAGTWTWADWRFEQFGYCTFLNFGRNYEGARDAYVYVYSHDHPSAYIAADRMILARVPTDRIADRSAYEFFAGLAGGGEPAWSADVSQREAVFTNERCCLRSGASYNAPLKRYLWWHQISRRPHADTRFDGGFGVYDAPEPWGPWTCVYYTECWDVGPGETGSFPPKWMSPDGKTVHLVFSGGD